MALDSTLNLQGTPLTEAEAAALTIAAGKRLMFPNADRDNEPYWVDSGGNLYPAMVKLDANQGIDLFQSVANNNGKLIFVQDASGNFNFAFIRQGPNVSQALDITFEDLPTGLVINSGNAFSLAGNTLSATIPYADSGTNTPDTYFAKIKASYAGGVFTQLIEVERQPIE